MSRGSTLNDQVLVADSLAAFRLVGDRLFEGASLDAVLTRSGNEAVLDALSSVFGRTTRVSQLQARREITSASRFERHLVLGAPGPLQISAHRFGCRAMCSVAFTGDPNLFRVSVEGAAPARTLRAHVCEDKLVVALRCHADDQPLIAPAIRSELDAIDAQASAQRRVIDRYNLMADDQARKLIATHWETLRSMRPFIQARNLEIAKRDIAELEALLKLFKPSSKSPFKLPSF